MRQPGCPVGPPASRRRPSAYEGCLPEPDRLRGTIPDEPVGIRSWDICSSTGPATPASFELRSRHGGSEPGRIPCGRSSWPQWRKSTTAAGGRGISWTLYLERLRGEGHHFQILAVDYFPLVHGADFVFSSGKFQLGGKH